MSGLHKKGVAPTPFDGQNADCGCFYEFTFDGALLALRENVTQ
jgi:hypothetical protein